MEENNEQTQQTQQEQLQQPQTIEDILNNNRANWVKEITELCELFKTLPGTDSMLNQVYVKRQNLVDYYFKMNDVILKQQREYKKLFNDMFNNIKINGYNGMRLATDQAITRTVEAELGERKENLDLLLNHNNYIKETMNTLDNIIYGINQKVKIYEMINGLKNI